jgi:hypothetical protein
VSGAGDRDHAGERAARRRRAAHLHAAGRSRRRDRELRPVKLRLDVARAWIMLSESNHFVRPELDLQSVPDEGAYFGAIPPTLFAWVKRHFVALARGEAHVSVPRIE